MHDVEVADEVCRDGIRQCADCLRSGAAVREYGKLRVEELVCVRNRDIDRKPVSGAVERRRVKAVPTQPSVDGSDGVIGRGK